MHASAPQRHNYGRGRRSVLPRSKLANFTAAQERPDPIVRTCARAYRERMHTLASMRELDVWYAETAVDGPVTGRVDSTFAEAVARSAHKARGRDNLQAVSKLTKRVDGRRRLLSDPPLLIPIDELVGEGAARRHEKQMGVLVDTYRRSIDPARSRLVGRFHYAGMARKVVGVRSVGVRTWVVLLLGRDEDDPLLMQVKEAVPSVLEPYLGRSSYRDAGERVVLGQRLIQASSDILLGWLRGVGPDGHEGDYYVRQLRDWKWSADAEAMTPQLLGDYGSLAEKYWPARMPAPATASRSRDTSVVPIPPTSLSPNSQRHMPTATSRTTRH
jgi:uncharacterized protein (DUF2252 family)